MVWQATLPTVIPRQPGVTDGAWAAADVRLVKEAQADAKAKARGKPLVFCLVALYEPCGALFNNG